MKKILTIDIGGTFIKYGVMTGARSFKLTAQNKIPTPKESHEELLKAIADIFDEHNDTEGIALSMPGLIDVKRGVCISSGALEFSNGHCITEELQDMCGVRVTVENDANCAALAEAKAGSLADVKNGFVMVFGTSIGGAFICNKKIYRGSHFCAGEIAFTFQNPDGKNIYHEALSAVLFKEKCEKILNLPPEKVTGEMIFNLIAENNNDMLDALYQYAHAIAVKIYNIQMLFDPERIAIGGGISRQQIFIKAIQDKIDELYAEASADFLPRPEIVACKFHNDANLFGALYHHLRKGV